MSDIDITGSISNEPTITGQFEPDIVIQGNVDSQFPAQVSVASVTTGDPGTDAAVVNVGTPGNARLQFTIPRGDKGEQGDTGPQGIQGETGPAGADSTVPGPAGADGVVQSLVAGSNITIDATDPANPVINSTASGSGDVVGPASAVDGTPMVADGTTGKLLKNITYTAFKALLSLVKGDVGLGNVDNTADSAKSVLSATKLSTARNIDGQSFDGTAAITVIAPGTHAATGKNTPVDADELAIVDSAASNVLKKLTWANLKATLKTYFDSLSTTLSNKTLASPVFSGTVSGAGTIPSSVLASTAVTAGSYTSANITVNAQGQLTAAANGSGGGGRTQLTGNFTYYVATSANGGSDSNPGTSGSPFLTIQKAINTVAALDLSIYNVTIQVGAGTYTGTVLVNGPWVGLGTVSLIGDNTTPANVVISTTSADAVTVQNNGILSVGGFKVQTTTLGSGFAISANGTIFVVGPLVFGATPSSPQISASNGGKFFNLGGGNITISGGGFSHVYAQQLGGVVYASITVTLTGTPAFSNSFAGANNVGFFRSASVTYSGSATGSRYFSSANSVIQTDGAGASALPGNAVGTTSSGGQYL
jgi:hypothetical protein